MNELKSKLTALGLGEEMSEQVIATVADFAKSKIPASYHAIIDDALAGKTPDIQSLLGGFFGR